MRRMQSTSLLSQKDEVVGTVLPSPTSPHLMIEQPARPQRFRAGKRFAPGEPGSDYPSRAMVSQASLGGIGISLANFLRF
jgi:hypothetical protein